MAFIAVQFLLEITNKKKRRQEGMFRRNTGFGGRNW
jgi:hypothetical protein